ncbi:DUF2200 family protein [Shewanella maritima]
MAKIERKGRTVAELNQVICWLTGYSKLELQAHIKGSATFEVFFFTCHN